MNPGMQQNNPQQGTPDQYSQMRNVPPNIRGQMGGGMMGGQGGRGGGVMQQQMGPQPGE